MIVQLGGDAGALVNSEVGFELLGLGFEQLSAAAFHESAQRDVPREDCGEDENKAYEGE